MKTNRRQFVKKIGLGLLGTAIPAVSITAHESIFDSLQDQTKQVKPPTKYDWQPDAVNKPIGIAQGIFPGRVAWAHAPGAAHWQGEWKSLDSPWWLDENTDQQKIDEMIGNVLLTLSGEKEYTKAWKRIF